MKMLKLITLSLCFILAFGSAEARQQESKTRLTSNFTMQAYIDAMHHGKLKGFSDVVEDNAKFTMQRGDKVIIQTKSDMLKALKKQENIEQNCKVSQSVIQTLPNQMIMQVDMKYDTFTRINYVTLSESSSGWRVSQVSSTFK